MTVPDNAASASISSSACVSSGMTQMPGTWKSLITTSLQKKNMANQMRAIHPGEILKGELEELKPPVG